MRTPEEERERLILGHPPRWAGSWGEDEHGVFASIVLGQVEQRMRWIPAGKFWMGSPDGEQGRYEREGPRHEVTLSHGYWMADTPCTQQLWEAVMGENPSSYVSPRRPVEGVSWEHVQRFLGRLNMRVRGLDAGLPSEAQWEYACRAETEEATYAGPMAIRGANDAPVLDKIAWYGGNSGVHWDLGPTQGGDSSGWPDKQHPHERAGTREVGLKRPNEWGLYDMLGNVWEWCADAQREYHSDSVEDPFESGRYRVYRGGSWYDHARRVRAAYRDASVPGLRLDYLGFRLVRGQYRPEAGQQ